MGVQKDGTVFVLENEWLSRHVDVADGVETTRYCVRPHGAFGAPEWHTLMFVGATFPYEATVTLNGAEYQASAVKPKPGFSRAGGFAVQETRVETWTLGSRLSVVCRPRLAGMPDLTVTLRYDLADRLPLLVRSMTVVNTGRESVRLDNMVVEPLPGSKYTYAHEIFTFTDYYTHYGAIEFPDRYYSTWVRHQFPTAMNLTLKPGQSTESFRLFEYTAPYEENARAAIHHRVFKAVAPWTCNPPVQQICNTAKTLDELHGVIDRAADLGFEMIHLFGQQVFTNCGDFEFLPHLFPRGASDAKALVAYAHARGIRLVPYVGLAMATQEGENGPASRVVAEHPDWQYLGPDGIRYLWYAFGNMCYQSGWGDYIKEKCRWLLEEIGFDGLHVDGPYHWLPCLETGHRHETPEAVHYMNWAWEREFFGSLAARGAYVSTPQDTGALLLGTSLMPGGYTEEDYSAVGGMPQVSLTRSFLYDAQEKLHAACRFTHTALEPYHGHSIDPSEEHPESYEHAVATCFGLGHAGMIVAGSQMVLGPKTEAILKKWIAFFRRYRTTLSGDTVRLQRPDGKHPDAVLHVNPSAAVRAVLVAFNPSPNAATLTLRLPLHAAGFAPGSRIALDRHPAATLDSQGQAGVEIVLTPFEVRWWEVQQA